jgi:hypothetical protein
MRPSVFVSSTVLDFEDLRGSLKYYLEQFGFNVQMSEYPDFSIDPSVGLYENCLNSLKNCQYYILLIGFRYGTKIKLSEDESISITNAEYRAARELIEKGYPLRIISFVRKPIWLLRDEREGFIQYCIKSQDSYNLKAENIPNKVFDDPESIFNFILEVKGGVKLAGEASPVNNWIFDFNQFEEIATALQNVFHIKENLNERLLKLQFIAELEENKCKLLTRSEISLVPTLMKTLKFDYANVWEFYAKKVTQRMMEEIGDYRANGGKGVSFNKRDINTIVLSETIIMPEMIIDSLGTRFLAKVIDQGLFWEFNVTENEFVNCQKSKAIQYLFEKIEKVKKILQNSFADNWKKELAKIATNGSLHSESVDISFESFIILCGRGDVYKIFCAIDIILEFLKNDNLIPLQNYDFSDKI